MLNDATTRKCVKHISQNITTKFGAKAGNDFWSVSHAPTKDEFFKQMGIYAARFVFLFICTIFILFA